MRRMGRAILLIVAAGVGGGAVGAEPNCALTPACVARLGAGALPASGACADELASYRACLVDAVERGGPIPAAASEQCDDAVAERLWSDVKHTEDCGEISAFALTCPSARQVTIARARLARLGCGVQEEAADGASDAALVAATLAELQRLGHLSETPSDGPWGAAPRAALAAFQRGLGVIPAVGEPGAVTLEALKALPHPPGGFRVIIAPPAAVRVPVIQQPPLKTSIAAFSGQTWRVYGYQRSQDRCGANAALFFQFDGDGMSAPGSSQLSEALAPLTSLCSGRTPQRVHIFRWATADAARYLYSLEPR